MSERRNENTSNPQAVAGLVLIAFSVLLLMCLISYDWGDVRLRQPVGPHLRLINGGRP